MLGTWRARGEPWTNWLIDDRDLIVERVLVLHVGIPGD
jgi:hypothetical protein